MPGERQKLHVFEPRYKQLMKDLMAGEWQFGIPFAKGGRLYKYGSYVKIIKTTSYNPETGEMDIIVEGEKTFRLDRFLQNHNNKPYDAALVEWLNDEDPENTRLLVENFKVYHDQLKKDFKANNYINKANNIWNIVKFLPLTEDEKIRFVSLCTPERRKLFLQNKLKELAKINSLAKSLGEQIYYN